MVPAASNSTTPAASALAARQVLSTYAHADAPSELLAQRNDNALGAANVAEPVGVLVLDHFADQFGAAVEQARDDGVEVINGEHDAAYSQCVNRRVHRGVRGPGSDRLRRVELVQLDPPVAVRGAQEREGGTDVLKADETVDHGAPDGRLALQLQSEIEKEGLHGLKVVDDDEDVV